MAALAFCVDTGQQRDLSDAKIVTIITNEREESEIIPRCDKTNSKDYVSACQLGQDSSATLSSSSCATVQPIDADVDCSCQMIGVVPSSRRK